MNILKLAWKNILHKPLNSGLSVVLMASGLSVIIVLLLTNHQIADKYEKNLAGVDLVVGAKGSPTELILSSIYQVGTPTGNIKLKQTELIKRNPFVEKTIPISLGDSYEGFRIVGTTLLYLELYDYEIAEGDVFEAPMEAVIGSEVAKKTGLEIGDEFKGGHGVGEVLHNHDEFLYEVVGILEKSGTVLDNLIITPTESPWIVHSGHENEGGSFELKSKEEYEAEHTHHNHDEHDHHHDHDHAHHHVDDIDEILANLPDEKKEITSLLVFYKNPRAKFTIPGQVNNNSTMMAVEPQIEVQKLMNLLSSGIDGVMLMGYFILIISAISVFISLYNSLKDRTYEIALQRVMGASRLRVLLSVLFEGLILSALGCVVGLILSHGGMHLVAKILEENYKYQFTGFMYLPQENYLLLACLIIGLISAIIPAIMAYKTNISTTLNNTN
jgi:putative ABC transport system permease protein